MKRKQTFIDRIPKRIKTRMNVISSSSRPAVRPYSIGVAERAWNMGQGGSRSYQIGRALTRAGYGIRSGLGTLAKGLKNPYVQAAWLGTEAAIGAYNYFNTKKETEPGKPIEMSGRSYQGKFAKPMGSDRKQKINGYYSGKGIMRIVETHGTCSSPDAVYVGHSTYYPSEISNAIAIAIIKKLFLKGKFLVGGNQEILRLNDQLDPLNFWVKYSFNQLGSSVPQWSNTHSLIASDTPTTIANNCGLVQFIYDTLYGGNNNMELVEIHLGNDELQISGTKKYMVASINLRQEVLELYIGSEIEIMNQTKSDTGSNSTEQIDVHPVKGYHYQFVGGTPKDRRYPGPNYWTNVQLGIILQRDLDLGNVFKEPPPKQFFTNCVGSRQVGLEPGAMKKSKIEVKYVGYLNNIIAKLTGKWIVPNPGTPKLMFAPGKSELFGLEEFIQTGSTQNITIKYEREYRIGAVLITNRKTYTNNEIIQNQISNVTA